MSWLLPPFLIFLARTTDMTIGTIRSILVYRGHKALAFTLGFIETIIWITAAGYVFQNLSNPMNAIGFAAGFAFGNVVGIFVEEKLAVGLVLVRIFAMEENVTVIADEFKKEGYGVTTINAHGSHGPIKILYIILKRKTAGIIMKKIQAEYPKLFFSLQDIRSAKEGIFPGRTSSQPK